MFARRKECHLYSENRSVEVIDQHDALNEAREALAKVEANLRKLDLEDAANFVEECGGQLFSELCEIEESSDYQRVCE